MNNNKEEIQEDFCPSCLVVPLAFAGAGATAVGATNGKEKKKKWKKALLISGIVTLVITAGMAYYYFGGKKKNCNQCKLKL